MPDKLNHAVAVKALHDICTESAANVNSGDVRIAGESRRDYLFASIMLQVLSAQGVDTFENAELAKLPTPEELAAADNEGLAATIVTTDVAPDRGPTPQPQNADDLQRQEGGAEPVAVPSTATPEATPDVAPAPTPDTTPATTPEATPATPDIASPDAAPPATPDTAPPAA